MSAAAVAVACSDANYDPVGCNDPLCAYGDCNTAVTDPIDNFSNAPAIGLATHSTEDGGTAIASKGNSLTQLFTSLANTAVATSAAINAPKPTSGITLPGIGSVGTFGGSGLFILAALGLLLYFVFGKRRA